MELPENLKNELQLYCDSNNIIDVNEFIIKLIKQAFTIEKYGINPIISSTSQPTIQLKGLLKSEDLPVIEQSNNLIQKRNQEKDIYGE